MCTLNESIATTLDLAARATQVVRRGVPIVALLGTFELPIATALELAARAAAIAGGAVSVVATFTELSLLIPADRTLTDTG
jgi:hypothetical protein